MIFDIIPHMTEVYFSKEKKSVEVEDETTILSLALANEINMNHRCGAEVRCSSCKVRILEGMEGLSEPSTAETRLLEKFRYPEFIRLGCQTKIDPSFEGKIEVGTIIKTHNKNKKPRIPARFLKK